MLSEKKLVSLITKILNETLETEGIDITTNREVTMTDTHEERVNTSLVANPTCTKDIIPNIEVWSIFKDCHMIEGMEIHCFML